MRALLIAAVLVATPALAQNKAALAPADGKVWTPAPVPGTGQSAGAPADRAGIASDADLGAPFSATPTGALSGSGRSGSATVGTTSSTDTVTPNLSR